MIHPDREIPQLPCQAMTTPRNVEFDRYASEYTNLHRASIRASGEEPAFFSAVKAKYMAKWLGSRASSPLNILDFGCGIGNSIMHLQAAFPTARLHGVDPSSESIRLAGETHNGAATFHMSGESALPYASHRFDVVQAACVFHHIPPQQRHLWMREIHRVMKPGGSVFVFEHNVLNPLTVKAVRDCPFDADAILLPRRELLELARETAFKHIQARYIVFFPKPLALLRPLEPLLGWVPLGAQYVVHALA